MTEEPERDEIALGVVTALADSIIRALPKSRQAVAAMNVKGHVLDIEAREKANTASETHSEVKDVLQAFFTKLAETAKA
ncbi:hypothetical protein [Caulobacter sp. FWC2]|uniref:hypothetical protein n=1 Tax=Caulobacter sp. FWC2 TaxID=69664 RepID=UPI000C14A673|nr:hypothetical protein [Caulobacter sp. FWC2]PIB91268.1 hypothetical protein CSW62_06580 [Caulobacter sp. FWC2]